MIRLHRHAAFFAIGWTLIVGLSAQYYALNRAQADQPHRESCECRELVRIRMMLERQFGIVCDERHCEGQSSSGQGGSLP